MSGKLNPKSRKWFKASATSKVTYGKHTSQWKEVNIICSCVSILLDFYRASKCKGVSKHVMELPLGVSFITLIASSCSISFIWLFDSHNDFSLPVWRCWMFFVLQSFLNYVAPQRMEISPFQKFESRSYLRSLWAKHE